MGSSCEQNKIVQCFAARNYPVVAGLHKAQSFGKAGIKVAELVRVLSSAPGRRYGWLVSPSRGEAVELDPGRGSPGENGSESCSLLPLRPVLFRPGILGTGELPRPAPQRIALSLAPGSARRGTGQIVNVLGEKQSSQNRGVGLPAGPDMTNSQGAIRRACTSKP